jgi:hypothetical protein
VFTQKTLDGYTLHLALSSVHLVALTIGVTATSESVAWKLANFLLSFKTYRSFLNKSTWQRLLLFWFWWDWLWWPVHTVWGDLALIKSCTLSPVCWSANGGRCGGCTGSKHFYRLHDKFKASYKQWELFISTERLSWRLLSVCPGMLCLYFSSPVFHSTLLCMLDSHEMVYKWKWMDKLMPVVNYA